MEMEQLLCEWDIANAIYFVVIKFLGLLYRTSSFGCCVVLREIVHETFALRYDEAFCAFHGDESAGFKIFLPLLWVMGSAVL